MYATHILRLTDELITPFITHIMPLIDILKLEGLGFQIDFFVTNTITQTIMACIEIIFILNKQSLNVGGKRASIEIRFKVRQLNLILSVRSNISEGLFLTPTFLTTTCCCEFDKIPSHMPQCNIGKRGGLSYLSLCTSIGNL